MLNTKAPSSCPVLFSNALGLRPGRGGTSAGATGEEIPNNISENWKEFFRYRTQHWKVLHCNWDTGRGNLHHNLSPPPIRFVIKQLQILLPSAARPIIATYRLRISASVYIYICIYVYLSVPSPGGPPGQRHVFKMASLAVTWMPSSNL